MREQVRIRGLMRSRDKPMLPSLVHRLRNGVCPRPVVAGDAEKFVKVLKSFFANIPYNLTDRQNEQMWQTMKAMDCARDALAEMLGN